MFVLTKETLALVNLSDKEVLAQIPVDNIMNADNSGHYTLYYSSRMDAVIIGAGIGSSTYAYRLSDGGELDVLDVELPGDVKDVIDYDGATYFATDGGGLVRWESETSSVVFTPSTALCQALPSIPCFPIPTTTFGWGHIATDSICFPPIWTMS